MTADEIKKAIKNLIYSNNILSERIENMEIAEKFNDGIYLNLDYCKEEYKSVKLAIQVLQSELERIGNKPLTIEQLKNMVGEPVFDSYDQEFIILDYCLLDMMCSKYIDITNRFYKYKPQEE